ncbi:MAG TPA: hypothetical protein VLF59_03925 [Candidatus Saccharimonadales bacterium]|nr:hypothetical protein [Candidatus Saccharimonadales bacterium]
MLRKLLGILMPEDQRSRDAQIHRNIIRDCARMGGTLFGEIPKGGRREFFCLDEHTWVWHEEWTDANNIRHTRTTRYDIRPHGIFKAQDGAPYQPLSADETHRFYMAAYQYVQNLHARFDPLIAAAAA